MDNLSTNHNILKNLLEVRGEYKIDEPLKKYTWLKIGGPADVMFFPEDIDDLQTFLRNKNPELSVFIIGGGSNLLIKDKGICGVVIKLQNKNFAKVHVEDNKIYCGAGMLNSALKKTIAENGLGGLEFLCSIPGTMGGTLRTNAGCFGAELSDVLLSAQVMDFKGNIFTAENKDFNFAYRYSQFPEDWIVLELCLRYEKASSVEIKQKIDQYDEYRFNHQPHGIYTAGSTFKNPRGYRAWELIKNAGGNSFAVGGVKMSPQHCNFLENDGTATASDVEKLGDKIITAVEKQTGIKLEWEIKIVGRK